MKMIPFRGTATALVTPFRASGELDLPALRSLVESQIAGGVEALLALGTTGENPTISETERDRIIETIVEAAAGRIPLIVGTGSNDTAMSARFAKRAETLGADAQLVVGPFYNKPTQEGFRAHVEHVAAAADLPIILYNVPGRTSFGIEPETTLRLAEDVAQVIGIKEASGSLPAISDILAGRPEGFAVYAGDDELAVPVALLGGDGVVSVISNVLPAGFSSLVREALAGHTERARQMHFALLPAMRACFKETNPTPVKWVMARQGLLENALRLPMLPLSQSCEAEVLGAFSTHLEAESELSTASV